MCPRLLIPVVILALCGVSAGQEEMPAPGVPDTDMDREVRKAVQALIADLKDKDKDMRRYGALSLGEIGPAAKEAIPELIAAVRDEDSHVRFSAALALGEIGPAAKDATPALIAALKDEEQSVQLFAVYALGKIGPAAKAAVPALEAAARDGVRGAEPALKQIRGEHEK